MSVGDIRGLIGGVISNIELADQLDEHSALIGALPKLDLMAVVNLILGREGLFDFR